MNQSSSYERELRWLGLRRTGNHAAINWALKQETAPAVFANNVNPQVPWKTKYPLPAPDDRAAGANIGGVPAVLYHSYEDHLPAYLTHPPVRNWTARWIGKGTWTRDILIIRDPYNMAASRLRGTYPHLVRFGGCGMMDMWLVYAREALRETRAIPDEDFLCFNYNRWCHDMEYRKELARQLEVPFSDAGRDEVTRFGGGSSFDGTAKAGSELQTGGRWKEFAGNPEFDRLFDDRQIFEKASALFDLGPDLEEYGRRMAGRANPARSALRRLKMNLIQVLGPRWKYARYHKEP